MTKRVFNIKEPEGAGVIRSRTGTGEHVKVARGQEYVRKVVTGDVMKQAAAARRAAKSG